MTTLSTRAAAPAAPPRRRDRRTVLGLVAVAALGVVHALVVAPHYAVGSFDDDGHYLGLARAFAHGLGYVDTSAPGAPVETVYPPGYSLLLTPIVWLTTSLWALRALSLAAFVGCVPLLHRVLDRPGVSAAVRWSSLALFALNPVAATFATEVMPEMVFLLVLLGIALALPRWERSDRIVRWSGVMVAVGAPFLVLLKYAGLPMLLGVAGWLLLRRRWRHVAAVACAAVLMIGPLLLVRLLAHGSVVGDRYTTDYSRAGAPVPAALSGIGHYIVNAVPWSVIPISGAHLYGHSAVLDALLDVVRYTEAPLLVLGALWWWRRRGDFLAVVVPLYLAETAPFPYINARRVVLLLPFALAWWAAGVAVLARWSGRLPLTAWARRPVGGVAAIGVLAILAVQLPRDYLLESGQRTPRAAGSGYVAALRLVTPPGWSIETGYRWTISTLTGRTANNTAQLAYPCSGRAAADAASFRGLFHREHIATALDAELKFPGQIDAPCVLAALQAAPWAVPVFTGRDDSSVFVVTGAGTPRPDRAVLDLAAPPSTQPLEGDPFVREVLVEVPARSAAARVELLTAAGWQRPLLRRSAAGSRLLDLVLPHPVRVSAVRIVGLAPGQSPLRLAVLGHR